MNPEISKPEWFQMAQEDGFAPKSTRKRTLRIMALATPLLVLGAGFAFAQTQNSPTAGASPTASASSTPSATTDPISLSSTPAPVSQAVPSAAPRAVPSAAPRAVPSAAPIVASTQASNTIATAPTPAASITIKKPAITKPTGGGEDDGLVRSGDDD